MTLRELIVEYLCFAYDEESLMEFHSMTFEELENLSDLDLLELYDITLLAAEIHFVDGEENED